MDGLLGQSDGLIRLAVFAAVFFVMAAIELLRPKRRLSVSKARRWLTNLGIAGVDTLVLRLHGAPCRAACRGRCCVLRQGASTWAAQPGRLALLAESPDRAARARPRHLVSASRLAQSADLLAAASGASRRPRHRRDHGGAFPPCRDRALHAVEDRRGDPARRFTLRRVPVRGDPQRLRHVQSRQHCAPRLARPGVADLRRHARHASRASFGAAQRAQPEFRLQPVAMGPFVRDLSSPSRRRGSRA